MEQRGLGTRVRKLEERRLRVRPATRRDIPGVVQVSNSSLRPGEDIGFGGAGTPVDVSEVTSAWKEPNILRGREVLVAEMDDHVVGVASVEKKELELELVDIDVPLELQGRGIGTRIVRWIEEGAKRDGKRAVTLGTSRNAQEVAWKSLPWWQHLGYRITGEEENEWTRSIGPGAREIRMRKELT
jgi:GNAT superfamily N-acetyltransferase